MNVVLIHFVPMFPFMLGHSSVLVQSPEAYLEPSRTSTMELFAKIVNG